MIGMDEDPWRMIQIAKSVVANTRNTDPSFHIAVAICEAKGINPFTYAPDQTPRWQNEMYIALLQQAIVELEMGDE